MKLREVLVENNQTISERPMNIIKQGLTKLGAKFLPGSLGAKMQGKLDTGNVANTLYKDFATYLGKTGQQATDDSVRAFLRSKGADKEIDIEKILSSNVAETVALNRGALNKIFLQVAQELAKSSGGAAPANTAPSAPAGTVPSANTGVATAQPAGTQPGNFAPAPAQQQPTQAAAPQPTASVKPARQRVKKATTAAPQPAAANAPTAPQPAQQQSAPVKLAKQRVKKAPVATPLNTPAAPQAATAVPVKPARKRVKKATVTAPTNTSGQAKASFGATPFAGQQLPSYTETVLRAVAEAAYTGRPMTRKAYYIATQMLESQNVTLDEIGVKVVVKESSSRFVVLTKV